jgi:hypothetical protein
VARPRRSGRWRRRRVAALLVLLGVAGSMAWQAAVAEDWRTASREPVGLAPDPAATPEAVVQVYAARAWSWRAVFGVHTWVAVKPAGASRWRVYEALGWRAWRGEPIVAVSHRPPDARWYGNRPWLLVDLRGDGVDAVIAQVEAAAARYPFANRYRLWPGPNSNTFTAFVGREVPALRLDLPPTAIGKDYLDGQMLAAAPSGTGWQVSLAGLLGVMAAREEGLEVDVLGLTFGLDPFDPALKLPVVGRLGPAPGVRRLGPAAQGGAQGA